MVALALYGNMVHNLREDGIAANTIASARYLSELLLKIKPPS